MDQWLFSTGWATSQVLDHMNFTHRDFQFCLQSILEHLRNGVMCVKLADLGKEQPPL